MVPSISTNTYNRSPKASPRFPLFRSGSYERTVLSIRTWQWRLLIEAGGGNRVYDIEL
jgi:hypothetical protein